MRVRWMQLLLLGVCLLQGAVASAQNTKTLQVQAISDAPSFAKRALVIGIGQYEHAGSLAPVTFNDARRFADLLKTQFKFPEEAITLLTDAPGTPDSRRPTYIHLRNAFKTLLAGINDKSEVVVYFSGHGTRAADHDWLVPLDGVPSDVDATCINYDDFKSQLNTATPARALLIVDACRNLSGGKDAGSSGFGAGKGLSGPQYAELLSCRPKEESKVGKPEDFAESVFTHFLLQGLSGDVDAQENGTVTFDSLNGYVQGRVSQYVSSKYGEAQNPEGRASLGKMVLARAPTTQPIPSRPTLIAAPAGGGAQPRHYTGATRPESPQQGDIWVNPKDGAELVFIPAGSFLMGDDDDTIRDNGTNARNNPRHTVTLSGYWIYKNVVTVKQYKQFCQETGRNMPPEPGGLKVGDVDMPRFNPGWRHEDHPIVNVSWDDAKAYCDWAGVRLPTEAEWEAAARGSEGRKYPWGDDFDRSKLWCSKSKAADAGGTTTVGKYGISPYGVTDMAGNVWQWCADWYDSGYCKADHGANPTGPTSGGARVLRGGSWPYYDQDAFRSATRFGFAPGDRGQDDFGFRGASRP